jgi:5-methylcytosine-specific restriction protein A
MPLARRCLDCGAITTRPRCPACRHRRNRQRGTPADRGYDQAWRLLRLKILIRDGWQCQLRRPGCIGKATEVDHIVPLSKGGQRLDASNAQAACKPCNSGKRDRTIAPPA